MRGNVPAVRPSSPAAAPELTARALLLGGVLGVVLAAGNVYVGLKTGYIDSGSLTAALVGSALLGILGRQAASTAEVNLVQTVASSAAVMSFAAGVCAPIPALALAGRVVPGGVVLGWGVALGVLGVALGVRLRRALIEREGLAFPTGQATAEVIAALRRERGAGPRRLTSLLVAAAAAALLAWLRDGRVQALPQAWAPDVAIGGVAAAALTLGLGASPLLLSTGVLVGVRGAASLAAGALLAWGVLAPRAVASGAAAEASYPALVPVLLWPGLALMLAGALGQVALALPRLRRSLGDLRGLVRDGASSNGKLLPAAVVLALAVALGLATFAFGLPPLAACALVPIAVALAAASARAAGETDQAPVGQVGALAQIGLGGAGLAPSLAGGGLVTGIATQTAQTLWAFKAGHRLGASPRAQVVGQLLGALIGAAVVVPVYALMVAAHPLGGETMPAPAALAWKATSEAALGAAPFAVPLIARTTVAAALAGVALTLLGRRWRWLPSPTALGAAFVLPASASLAMLLGALLFAGVRRARPAWAEAHGASLGAGGIAGESLMGLGLAAAAVLAGG
jgi:uncharacterized oligopeptide transporter (OPT) family protein